MLRRVLAVFIVVLGSFVVVSPVGAVDPATGRITATVPVRVSDSRPGKLTMKNIGSGVKHLFFVNADGDGSASVRPCGSPAAGTDPSVALSPGISSQLRVVSSGTECVYSTVPVSLVVDDEGTVTSAPVPGGSQYVALSTPLGLLDAMVSSSSSLGRPSVLPADATAAVLSLTSSSRCHKS